MHACSACIYVAIYYRWLYSSTQCGSGSIHRSICMHANMVLQSRAFVFFIVLDMQAATISHHHVPRTQPYIASIIFSSRLHAQPAVCTSNMLCIAWHAAPRAGGSRRRSKGDAREKEVAPGMNANLHRAIRLARLEKMRFFLLRLRAPSRIAELRWKRKPYKLFALQYRVCSAICSNAETRHVFVHFLLVCDGRMS